MSASAALALGPGMTVETMGFIGSFGKNDSVAVARHLRVDGLEAVCRSTRRLRARVAAKDMFRTIRFNVKQAVKEYRVEEHCKCKVRQSALNGDYENMHDTSRLTGPLQLQGSVMGLGFSPR